MNAEEKEQVLVSIVMPIFNHPLDRLKASIHSILKQTYKNIELLIMDGRLDNVNYNIVKEFKDERIIYSKEKGYIK